MRIPQKVINLVEAMYHDMKTTLVFVGEAVGAIPLVLASGKDARSAGRCLH